MQHITEHSYSVASRNSCVKKVCTSPVMPCFEPYVPRSKYRVCDSNKTAHDNCYHKPIGQHSCNYINLKCVSIPRQRFLRGFFARAKYKLDSSCVIGFDGERSRLLLNLLFLIGFAGKFD